MAFFSILFKLGVDGSQFETNLKRAQSAGTAFAKDFKKEVGASLASAFAVGSVVAFAQSVVRAADEIGDLAEQLGITTDEVQRLQAASAASGVSFEKISAAVLKMNEARSKALEGDKAALDAFRMLGVSAAELGTASITNSQLVQRVSESFVDLGRPMQLQASVAKLLGGELVKATAAFAALRDLGPINLIAEKDIKALSEFNDRLDTLNRNTKVAAAPYLGMLAGRIEEFNAVADLLKSAGLSGSAANAITALLQANPTGNLLAKGALGLVPQSPGKIPFEGPLPEWGGSVAPAETPIQKAIGDLLLASQGQSQAPGFNLGAAQDPLARIGGFTSFGASQDRVIQNLQEQVRQLSYIARRADETVRALER